MQSERITLNSGNLSLKAIIELPDSPGRHAGAVLCHPHPLYGGNMDNNVIMAVRDTLIQNDIACLRFNFRGAAGSGGSFDDGRGEQDDALSAVSFLTNHDLILPGRIGIFGYSFGGMVAIAAAEKAPEIMAVAAVSPIVPDGSLINFTKPKLIICGSNDSVVDYKSVEKEFLFMAEPKRLELICGPDHFWRGFEGDVAAMVKDFFIENMHIFQD